MIGFDRTTIATEDGTVRMSIQRTPEVVHWRKPGTSADLTRRTSSGTNVVAMEMASRPCGRRKKV